MKLRILVSYSMLSTFTQTTLDYLNSFRALGTVVDYLHVTHDAIIDVCLANYDVVINSYCARLCFENYVSNNFIKMLKQFNGLKVIAVQDEYNRTDTLKRAIKDIGFDVVLTCVPEDSLEYVYPRREFPRTRFETVFTGYVPDYLAESDRCLVPLRDRPIVVGYRGRNVGGLYGRLGFDKFEIGRRMREICTTRGIPHDIAMDEESRIYGSAWFDFIGACRSMLGSESGSNVFDFDGSLERHSNKMTKVLGRRPSYAEFEPYVAQRDREISMGQISPRVFECAVMQTPMVLFRGRYSDAIEPDVHYIPLEKDFSNVDEVLARLERLDELEALAGRAYDHLVASGGFGYRAFTKRLAGIIDEEIARRSTIQAPRLETAPSVTSGIAPWLVFQPTTEPQPPSVYHLGEKKSYFVVLRDELALLDGLAKTLINRHPRGCDNRRGNLPSSAEKCPAEGSRHLIDEFAARILTLEAERATVSDLVARFANLTSIEEMDLLLKLYERQTKALHNLCKAYGAPVSGAHVREIVIFAFRRLPPQIRRPIVILVRFALNRLPVRLKGRLAHRIAYVRLIFRNL